MKNNGFSFLVFCCILCLASSPNEDECAPTPCQFSGYKKGSSVNTTCGGAIVLENILNRNFDDDSHPPKVFVIQDASMLMMAHVHLEGNCPKTFHVEWRWTAEVVEQKQAKSFNFAALTPTNQSYIILNQVPLLNTRLKIISMAILSKSPKSKEKPFLVLTESFEVISKHPDMVPFIDGGNVKIASKNKPFVLDASHSYDPISALSTQNMTYFWFCKEQNSLHPSTATATTGKTTQQIATRATTGAVGKKVTSATQTATTAFKKSKPKTASTKAKSKKELGVTAVKHTPTKATTASSTVKKINVRPVRDAKAKTTSNTSKSIKNTTVGSTNSGKSTVSKSLPSKAATPQTLHTSKQTASTSHTTSVTTSKTVSSTREPSTNAPTSYTYEGLTSDASPEDSNTTETEYLYKESPEKLFSINSLNCTPLDEEFRMFKATDHPRIEIYPTDARSQKYEFGLIVTPHDDLKDNDINFEDFRLNYIQRVTFLDADVPVVSTRCVYNCLHGHIQVNDKVILQAFGISSNINKLNLKWRIHIRNYESIGESVVWKVDTINDNRNPRLFVRRKTFQYRAPLVFEINMINAPKGQPPLYVLHMGAVHKADLVIICSINPKRGRALLTDFTVSCAFNERFIQVIEFHQKLPEGDILLKHSTSLNVHNVRLAAGDSSKNYSTELTVTILDEVFAHSIVQIKDVTVEPLPNSGKCKENYVDCLAKIVVRNEKSEADVVTAWQMAAGGDYQGAIQIAHVIAHMINSDRNDDDDSLYRKMMIKQNIVELLYEMPMLTFSAVKQLHLCLASVLFHEKLGTSLRTKDIAMDIIDKSSQKLIELVNFDWHPPNQPKNHVVVTLSSLILESLEKVFDVLYRQVGDANIELEHRFDKKFGNSDVPYEQFRTNLKKELNEKNLEYMKRTEKIFVTLRKALFTPEVENGEHITVASESLFTLHFYRSKYKDLAGVKFGILDEYKPRRYTAGYIRFPETPSLSDVTVDLQLIQYGRNPMAGFIGSLVNGMLPVSVKVTNVKTGAEITQFGSPIELYLRPIAPDEWEKNNAMIVKHPKSMTDEDVDVFKASVSLSHGKRRIISHAEPIDKKHQLQVLSVADHRPHLEDFNSNITLDVPSYFKPSILPSDLGASAMTVYIGVLPTAKTALRILSETRNATHRPILLYSLSLMALQCFHWDEKEVDWLDKKCQAAEQSVEDGDLMHCRCDSLSLFSGVSEPMTATQQILFPFKFHLVVPTCYVIVLVEIILLFIYLLLLILGIFCRRRCIANELLTTVIKDNDPYHRRGYLVSVSTSSASGASTDFKVAIRLFGLQKSSQVHILSDKSRAVLRAGSIDHFLILTKHTLGPLSQLTFLAFSEKETQSPWLMKTIEIDDLSNLTCWSFDFNADSSNKKSGAPEADKHQPQTSAATKIERAETEERDLGGNTLKRRFRMEYVWTDWMSLSSVTLVVLFILLALFLNLLLRGLPSTDPAEHIGRYGFSIIAEDMIFAILSAALLVFAVVCAVFLRNRFFDERRLHVVIDLDKPEDAGAEGIKGTEPVLAPPGDEKPEKALDEKSVFLIDVGRPDEGHYDLIVEPIRKPKPKTKEVREAQSGIEEVEDESAREKEARRAKLFRQKIIKIALLSLWVVIIVILALVNALFGLRLSHTCAHIWLFCSLMSVLVCALLLHPLAIVLQVLLCPVKAEKVNQVRWLAEDLQDVLTLRDEKIKELGGAAEYQKHLANLRSQQEYKMISGVDK